MALYFEVSRILSDSTWKAGLAIYDKKSSSDHTFPHYQNSAKIRLQGNLEKSDEKVEKRGETRCVV